MTSSVNQPRFLLERCKEMGLYEWEVYGSPYKNISRKIKSEVRGLFFYKYYRSDLSRMLAVKRYEGQ